MSKYDLRAIAESISVHHPNVKVYVDTVYHPPTSVEFRCKHGRIRVWQSGNAYPRLDVSSLLPSSYPLLRDVLDALYGPRTNESGP